MLRRSTFWFGAAVVFVVINLAGAVSAAVGGELLHTVVHVVLLVPGVWLVKWLSRRGNGTEENEVAEPGDLTDRLNNLEQSVDAVAIEIERIGEGQRFMTRVLTDRAAQPVAMEQAAPPAADVADSAPQSPRGSPS
jgi:hypothetical protein